jgi:F0F1-type ATP synthase delta subunit
MRYSTQNYAKALASAILRAQPEDGERIIRNFTGLLRRSGDEIHATKIIKETSRILLLQGGGREIVFESARPLAALSGKALREFATDKDVTVSLVDPSLIAGVRITVDGEREFDGSLKGKLDKMFGNV